MKQIYIRAIYSLAVLSLVVAASVFARAQTTQRPSHGPTKQVPNSPFGTDWAKPPGTTGSYIYNDPRLRDPNGPYEPRGSKGCPAPMLYDPASGRCR
jgi:hypothetical protein